MTHITRRQALAATVAAALAPHLYAQTPASWPTRTIRLIVPFPPGGGTDFISRTIATKLSEATGWTVVPDNRAGAGGTIGLAEAARAENSGHTLVMGQLDNLVIAPMFYKNLTYDAQRDLEPIALTGDMALIYVAPANSPYKSLAELIEAARRAPDELTYASPGIGTSTHLSVELLQHQAGIRLRAVHYKGSGPATTDTLGGQVNMLTTSIPSVLTQIKAGKLRALAVTSATRNPMLPDVPTVAEQGVPGFDVTTWYGLFAPKGAPDVAIQRVNVAVNRLLQTDEVRNTIQSQGGAVVLLTPRQLAQRLEQDTRKWRAGVAAAGLHLELS